MNETKDVLLKKTRDELDIIAVKLGIKTAGLAKTRIAESIVEARNKAAAKETPKPKIQTPKAAPPAKIKEAPRVAVIKPRPKTSIGKKGVYAKCEAIDAQINENNEAVDMIGVGIDEINKGINDLRSDLNKKARKMLEDGASNLHKGAKEMDNGIDAQKKANKKAAANMEKGVKEIHTGIKEMQTSIQDGIKVMYSGVKIIQTGIKEMGVKFEDFRNDAANYKHDFYYG